MKAIDDNAFCLFPPGAKVYSVRGEQNIMQELVTKGPVEAAFTVYSDFPQYKSGEWWPFNTSLVTCKYWTSAYFFSITTHLAMFVPGYNFDRYDK